MSGSFDFRIKTLGECKIPSPMPFSNIHGDSIANFVNDEQYVLHSVIKGENQEKKNIHEFALEMSGPRAKIFFNPGHVHAGIVTCGGLCPGLNGVIRAIVRTLWQRYGVRRISGVRYGFVGFMPEENLPTMTLNPDVVDDIHNMGGTILGSARGGSDVTKIVDALEQLNMNMLFTIGGDGTQRCALEVTEEIKKRGLKIAVVGIPKTVDNDLKFTDKSFGFDTAVSKAETAVHAAHVEAKSAMNGMGLVKVMGREAGFIAAHTTLATSDVNFCLIPEVPFDLEGENGLLRQLEKRLRNRGHAVILVAEGAGQELLAATNEKDPSGNKKMADIGLFLKDQIIKYFKDINMNASLKYIDPSYMIRASRANPNDSLYCARLGANAVHAAMAGKTGMLVSEWNNCFVHVPTQMAVHEKNQVDPESPLWRDVLEATYQPIVMKDEKKK
ncbi:ATP-dependent 6-phosphofructokinase [Oceanispirochaeta sp. M1]|uniref:ATP-dependent 6-phosphofructokinase n=1 Tax=Oceanispirochaeta sp. M1 TaxID=2283433 RepID=UPI000E096F25|nr:ATP-dependent 6-phosphofructokinase [Oceanispirochaeta sp. M1]NPD73376.1 ATP-dependent 6-phosphofructokinase [Oceanispirochaeta sp. M1]RDG30853.1 ATP-dependent 6-phosphofructokinase [Oceanispirochaeta sp. M1]